jgi:uncharacterized protein YutE (UPF0331/DUF86 family)
MVIKEVLYRKIGALERHLGRIREKRVVGLSEFLDDLDRQESLLFNLQMAIQNCIDITSHVVNEEGLGIAGSVNELFYLLQERGILDHDLTERMVRPVGFRNLLVHEYGKVDLDIVYRVAQHDIQDMELFIKTIMKQFG